MYGFPITTVQYFLINLKNKPLAAKLKKRTKLTNLTEKETNPPTVPVPRHPELHLSSSAVVYL